MKNLFIVRHGKSTWEYDSIDDIDRPLKTRGIADGYWMAGSLRNQKLQPDLIVSSNACRAFHTATIFHRVLQMNTESFRIEPVLYLSGVDEILNVIYGVGDKINSLMIFGHNPGFTEISNHLSTMSIDNVPTTGLVHLVFDTLKWTKIGRDVLVKESFDFPRKK
ncbi:MAG: SixA phosphatase family protein [Bacteroidota bacterium]